MKKSFAIIFSAALAAGFSSCTNEEDDIFPESSAQRLNHAIEEYTNLLCSAENGWEMLYFANEEEPGYPMLVKFSTDGSVTIAADNYYSSNNEYKTETSLYDVLGSNGPLLTFNTYNTLLHVFSTPEDIPETGTDDNRDDEQGLGHEGDYEFVIYEGTADRFVMKGSKHGLTIIMKKLPADVVWENYFTETEALRDSYFSTQVPTLLLSASDGAYTVTGMLDGYTTDNGPKSGPLMKIVPEGGDPITQTTTMPYIVSYDGTIHFCSPFEGESENMAIQNFRLADDGASFLCTDDGQSAELSCYQTPAELLTDTSLTWAFAKDDNDAFEFGGKLATAMAAVEAEATALDVTLESWMFSYDNVRSRMTLYFTLDIDGTSAPGRFYVELNPTSDGGIEIVSDGTGNTEATQYAAAIPALRNFALALAGSWTLEPTSRLRPDTIRMVSATDSNDWFIVTKP